jgi:bifunctional N-acetylglucosamine-1-phosphate-uridyltransferase/glucosamine-1-phosphate-acetyltransferase GlmU-like protein
MKANGYAGEPVRLISCGTGACNATAAQKLANQIGAPVTAPSDTVWIHPNGTLTVGSEATVNSGAWNTFTPGVKP